MRRILAVGAFLCLLTTGAATAAPAQAETNRTLQFDERTSAGALTVVNITEFTKSQARSDQRSINAVGKVRLNIPPSKMLVLDVGRNVFAHPELLDSLSKTGIDAFKVSYFSMDDRDKDVFRGVAKHLRRFEGVKYLDFDRSDADDQTLIQWKNLPSLQGLTCLASSINGECFSRLSDLPEFRVLHLDNCKLREECFVFVPRMRKLTSLSAANCGISTTACIHIGLCRNLKNLRLHGNNINDRAIGFLKNLKSLNVLDLRDTDVTATGMAQLKGLPLTKIDLSCKRFSATEQKNVSLLFPNARIDWGKSEATHEQKLIFAPLR